MSGIFRMMLFLARRDGQVFPMPLPWEAQPISGTVYVVPLTPW